MDLASSVYVGQLYYWLMDLAGSVYVGQLY